MNPDFNTINNDEISLNHGGYGAPCPSNLSNHFANLKSSYNKYYMVNLDSFLGIGIGISAFLIIGLLHPVVIKGEYYFGTKIWPLFCIGGILCIVCSLIITNIIISSLLGVLGFSLFWSILELFQQKKRVEKGWFPKRENKQPLNKKL